VLIDGIKGSAEQMTTRTSSKLHEFQSLLHDA